MKLRGRSWKSQLNKGSLTDLAEESDVQDAIFTSPLEAEIQRLQDIEEGSPN